MRNHWRTCEIACFNRQHHVSHRLASEDAAATRLQAASKKAGEKAGAAATADRGGDGETPEGGKSKSSLEGLSLDVSRSPALF